MIGIKKCINSIRNYGFLATLKKILYKIRLILWRRTAQHKKIELDEKINFKDFQRIIVFENQFGWGKIMKQRPQHIASSADKDTLFIYGTTHMEIGAREGIKKLKDNLYLMDLVIHKQELIDTLKDRENKYLMIYSTDYIPMDVLRPYLDSNFKLIYEFVDGIDEKLCGKETAELLMARHKEIINNYDPYIVTTATKLYDSIKNEKEDANVSLITNGVDYEFFADSEVEAPEEMKKIRGEDNIIIGYYGAIASWFNYDTIKRLAAENEKYQIVLIGLDYDKTLDKSGILKLKNVHYLGKKEYSDLPKYLHHFDICTIPFVINEITLSTSPVKVFEYMAARKPIVTSELPECKQYKSVLMGKNDDEFVAKIAVAIDKMKDSEYLELLTIEAKENDWKHKFDSLIKLISNGEKDER